MYIMIIIVLLYSTDNSISNQPVECNVCVLYFACVYVRDTQKAEHRWYSVQLRENSSNVFTSIDYHIINSSCGSGSGGGGSGGAVTVTFDNRYGRKTIEE